MIQDNQQKDETEMLLQFCHEGVGRSNLRCEKGDCTEVRKCATDEEEACQQQCAMENTCQNVPLGTDQEVSKMTLLLEGNALLKNSTVQAYAYSIHEQS